MQPFKKIFATAAILLAQSTLAMAQTQTTTTAQAPQATPSVFESIQPLLPLLLIFGVIYFLMIRPQQKQARERQAQLNALTKGQQVITASGIYGKIVGIADNIITLEIADNCKIKIERNGIQSVVKEQ